MESYRIIRNFLSTPFLSHVFIPFAAMVLSAFMRLGSDQELMKLRLGAGCELFAFSFALDAVLLINKAHLMERLNRNFQAEYESIFIVALIMSVGLMSYSGRVQGRLDRHPRTYPLGQVIVCWILGIGVIAFHLEALLGG